MGRVILHVDMNSFFASVESLDHPEVEGKPMAVCGSVEDRRGIILAKNDIAKKYGIQTAEPVWQAIRKCPELILLPPHFEKYQKMYECANAIYRDFTDLVEPVGIDESYLDVTGSQSLFGTGEQIANAIRETVYNKLSLTVSVGVSFCKVFAKLGSDYKKPNATTVITLENYQQLLYPLPIRDLMLVGNQTAKILNKIGVYSIGDLADFPENLIVFQLGKQGHTLYNYVHALDTDPVRREDELEQIKSIGNGLTYKRDLTSLSDIQTGIHPLVESVGARLRKHKLKCWGVQVSIKDPNFHTIDRQRQLSHPTNLTQAIYDTALELIQASWNPRTQIRLITITAIHLVSEDVHEQLSLFHDIRDTAKLEALDRSLDKIREKYGQGTVKSASVINNDLGISDKSLGE